MRASMAKYGHFATFWLQKYKKYEKLTLLTKKIEINSTFINMYQINRHKQHEKISTVGTNARQNVFNRKYYASVMNIHDFMADNIGHEFVGLVAQALDDNYHRYNF